MTKTVLVVEDRDLDMQIFVGLPGAGGYATSANHLAWAKSKRATARRRWTRRPAPTVPT